MLEVGCSYGYFLAAARRHGWEVHGAELSLDASRFCRDELGVPVDASTLPEVRIAFPGQFDAVVAWHVIEHDPNPREFVAAAFDCLRPGGILALRLPNLGSLVAKLAGSGWQWLSPPEHVCMYSASSLRHLVAGSGFEVIEMRTARGNARNPWFEILRAGAKRVWLSSTAHLGGSNGKYSLDAHLQYQNRVWYRAAENAITLGTQPVDRLLSRWMAARGREAELVMVARRPSQADHR